MGGRQGEWGWLGSRRPTLSSLQAVSSLPREATRHGRPPERLWAAADAPPGPAPGCLAGAQTGAPPDWRCPRGGTGGRTCSGTSGARPASVLAWRPQQQVGSFPAPQKQRHGCCGAVWVAQQGPRRGGVPPGPQHRRVTAQRGGSTAWRSTAQRTATAAAPGTVAQTWRCSAARGRSAPAAGAGAGHARVTLQEQPTTLPMGLSAGAQCQQHAAQRCRLVLRSAGAMLAGGHAAAAASWTDKAGRHAQRTSW